MLLVNVLWGFLNITLPIIPIYLGIIKYYYKQENIIEELNYIAIVVVSALIILSCFRARDAMCQIVPMIMLFPPLFILYIIHLSKKKMKDRGFHDKIIASFMILLLVLYISFWVINLRGYGNFEIKF